MKKFDRTYELHLAFGTSWADEGKIIKIESPRALTFTIKKNRKPDANTGSFGIFNLGEKTRNKIQNFYCPMAWCGARLYAGYGKSAYPDSLVFDGDIIKLWSSYEKRSIIVRIEAGEGAYAMGGAKSTGSFDAKTPLAECIRILLANLKNYSKPDASYADSPHIETIKGQLDNNLEVFKTTWEQMKDIAKERFYFFIDYRVFYAFPLDKWNEKENPFEISADNGLLAAPQFTLTNNEYVVNIEMLFEPRLKLATLVNLNPKSRNPKDHTLSGEYIVDSIEHTRSLGDRGEDKCFTKATLALKKDEEESSVKNVKVATPKRETSSTSNVDLIGLFDRFKRDIFTSLHCHKLGIIESFDPDTQTASVRINHKGVFDGKLFDYPILKRVPVFIPAGGDAKITMPVSQGDTCLLLFSDRDKNAWLMTGANYAVPLTPRAHDISDGLAIVGFRSEKNKIPDYNAKDAELRNAGAIIAAGAEGKASIRNEDENLKNVLVDWIDLLVDIISNWQNSDGSTPGGGTLGKIPDLKEVKTRVEKLLK